MNRLEGWRFFTSNRSGSPVLSPESTLNLYLGSRIGPKEGEIYCYRDPLRALTYSPHRATHAGRVAIEWDAEEGDQSESFVIRGTCMEILSIGTCADALRRFACRCVREIPTGDGDTLWTLLDDNLKKVIKTREAYLDKKTDIAAMWDAIDSVDGLGKPQHLAVLSACGRPGSGAFDDEPAIIASSTVKATAEAAYRSNISDFLSTDRVEAIRSWQNSLLREMLNKSGVY